MEVDSLALLEKVYLLTGDDRIQAAADCLIGARLNAMSVERSQMELVLEVVDGLPRMEAEAYIRVIDRAVDNLKAARMGVRSWKVTL